MGYQESLVRVSGETEAKKLAEKLNRWLVDPAEVVMAKEDIDLYHGKKLKAGTMCLYIVGERSEQRGSKFIPIEDTIDENGEVFTRLEKIKTDWLDEVREKGSPFGQEENQMIESSEDRIQLEAEARQLVKDWDAAVAALDFGDYEALDEAKERIQNFPLGYLDVDEGEGSVKLAEGIDRIVEADQSVASLTDEIKDVNNDIQKQTDETSRKDETMAEKTNQDRNGVFITVPARISAKQESVRPFDIPGKGEDGQPLKLAEITLPKGTEVGGQDVSYYKFTVTDKQLDPGGQKYPSTHSILLPEQNNKTGADWNVKLQRDFGGYDSGNNWVPDIKEVECTTKELQTSMQEQYERYKNYRKEQQAEKNAGEKAPSLSNEAKDAREASGELGSKEPSAPEPAR